MTDKNKQELIIKILEDTKAFTENLLKENERLRLMVASLKTGKETPPEPRKRPEDLLGSLEERFQLLVDENLRLQNELDFIKEEITKAESESRDYYARYTEVEQQNETLANLYVTIHRLHSTFQFSEVILIIKEIIINLVGSESFAIFWVDEPGRQLRIIASEGEAAAAHDSLSLAENIINKAAQTSEIFISMASGNTQEPMACIPLKAFGRVIGVIAIYHLLGHKSSFSQTDFELFGLMADHAAAAIVGSLLFTQAGEDIFRQISAAKLLQLI
ncbi:MAG: GAF domain-containing protein [Acidobacteriota bacterium]